MSNRLTPLQYRTLNFIAKGPSGQTMLLPVYWRDPRSLHRYQHIQPEPIPGRDAGFLGRAQGKRR